MSGFRVINVAHQTFTSFSIFIEKNYYSYPSEPYVEANYASKIAY